MSNNLSARSISKLPTISLDQNNVSDLILISHDDNGSGKFKSYSTSISSLVNVSEELISANIEKNFGLSGLNVSDIDKKVDDIISSNITLKGTKTFEEIPTLKYSDINSLKIRMGEVGDGALVCKAYVNTIIDDSSMFIGQDSFILPDPQNNSPTTHQDDNLMIWRIPAGKRDSTQFVDDYGISDEEGVECLSTGNLVVYGWLADSGTVIPQEAWVAIYGMIVTQDVNSAPKWTILQLQPWIKTQNSNKIQYVGFNIPVKKGLRLKIKTGFAVDASATATNQYNTLTFENVQPNTFVGYIVTGGQ